MRLTPLLIVPAFACVGCLATPVQDSYAIIASKAVMDDPEWKAATVDVLAAKHPGAQVLVWEANPNEVKAELAKTQPSFTAFAVKPTQAGVSMTIALSNLCRALDEDPYVDTFWGVITGYDAESAKVLSEAGYSGTIEVMAGSNAYSTLSNLVAVTPESSRLGSTISENHITIFGIPIYANLDTYTDKDSSGAEVVKDCIDKNSLVMYIKGSGKLAYCAIDDLDGNLQATPFFSKVVKLDDPSAYNVISESKPMPLIPPKSVCWATVTASMGRRTALTINNNITVDTGAEQSLQNIEEQNSEEPEKTE